MATTTLHTPPRESGASTHQINPVSVGSVTNWLKLGLDDFNRSPMTSLLYGVIFSVSCLLAVSFSIDKPGFVVALLTGLVLLGPVLAIGTYTAARQHQAGERVSIRASLALIAKRGTNIALFAVLLMLIMVSWVRLSSLVFAIKFELLQPSVAAFGEAILTSPDGLMVLAFYISSGFLLATVVFLTSAVTMPMIIDRNTDPFTAIQASFSAIKENKRPMAVWAGLIVALTMAGIFSGFILMAVIFPWLGYASWHSYRELVK